MVQGKIAGKRGEAGGSAVPSLLEMGRVYVRTALESLSAGGLPLLAVDATCGNGHDALFLARCLNDISRKMADGACGGVIAFDVQQPALENASRLLAGEGLSSLVKLIHAGHETLENHLAPDAPSVAAAMFNLGYLPGSDKSVVTRASSTLCCLETLKRGLLPGGLILAHCYAGHSGGEEETEKVGAWFAELPYADWVVGAYAVCNKPRNSERLFLAGKRRN